MIVRIALFPKPVSWGLALSPDQRTLVWSQRDRFEADLMLVENFR